MSWDDIDLGHGCAALGTRAELGTRARPRKRVNGKAAAEVSLINIRPFYFFIGHLSTSSLCSPPILLVENRTSKGVKTFFFFTHIFSGKHELLVGTRKILAIDFNRFWHPDRKRLPTPDLAPLIV